MKILPFAALTLCGICNVQAERATVAVAANFAWPMGELEALFEAEGVHELTVVHGSTGQLYAQIVNGAPYDVFLAADRDRPGSGLGLAIVRQVAEAHHGEAGVGESHLGGAAFTLRIPEIDD